MADRVYAPKLLSCTNLVRGVRPQRSSYMFEARFRAVRTLTLGAAFLHPTEAFAEVPKNPTFTKDIAPIFQEKCEACHRPDSIAPMSLKSFAEVRPWVRSIKSRVESRNMPPWQ